MEVAHVSDAHGLAILRMEVHDPVGRPPLQGIQIPFIIDIIVLLVAAEVVNYGVVGKKGYGSVIWNIIREIVSVD